MLGVRRNWGLEEGGGRICSVLIVQPVGGGAQARAAVFSCSPPPTPGSEWKSEGVHALPRGLPQTFLLPGQPGNVWEHPAPRPAQGGQVSQCLHSQGDGGGGIRPEGWLKSLLCPQPLRRLLGPKGCLQDPRCRKVLKVTKVLGPLGRG